MIRKAVPEDIHAILAMGQAFFEETGWDRHADFDARSFAYSCGLIMDHGVFLVAERDGQPVGMVAAGIAPAYWNRNLLTGSELFWYCQPEFRKGLGGKLMDALETELRARGVFLASMSAEEGLRAEALGRLYRQRQYFPSERLFWKVLAA